MGGLDRGTRGGGTERAADRPIRSIQGLREMALSDISTIYSIPGLLKAPGIRHPRNPGKGGALLMGQLLARFVPNVRRD
eukprot:1271114-Amorphochlora_amoeboformis.AAC.1